MSIASAITNAQQKVANAYDAVDNKGGTLPATQDLSNLPTAISSIPTSSAPTLDSLTITPTTSQQSISPPSGVDGYDSITVNAVTSSIDSDIVASNIKSGVNILGVNGSVTELKGETRNVSITSTSGNTFTPTSGKNGITSIKVTPTNQARTVTPTTSSQSLTVNSGYSGNGTITVNAVTSSIDNNIQAGNIKDGVTILGVTGTYAGSAGNLNYIPREVVNGVYQMPTSSFTFSLPSNATDLGSYALGYAFYGCTGITSADLSSLTTISGSYAMYYTFYNCTNLTSVDLRNLTFISNNNALNFTFRGCTALQSVDLSSLTTVDNTNSMAYSFYGCTNLASINFSNLTTIGANSSTSNYSHFAYAFNNCTSLTSITFPKLEKIYCTGSSTTYGTFANNNKVQKFYFPKLNTITYGTGASSTYQNACKYIFSNCSALTELHFAAANQSAIEASPGYSTAWGRGAGNVTIYFDL